MLYALIDTCAWLDLAKNIDGQKIIVTVRVLAHHGRLTLVAPGLVIDEFERNRERVAADMTRSLASHFRQTRLAIDEHGQEGRDAALKELDNLAHRVPLINQLATRNFDDIRELLAKGLRLTPTNEEKARVVQRGIDKRAPCHTSRNGVADAVLIELYSSMVDNPSDPEDRACFVTSNKSDFSAEGADDRIPHPDIAGLFADPRSHYYTSVAAAMAAEFAEEFDELVEEFDFREEPRNLEEIQEAEQELYDRIWYNRSIGHELKADDPERIRGLAAAGRKRVEETYGVETLGPYDDFEWGMLSGKLSALRWVLGSEWDFLDT